MPKRRAALIVNPRSSGMTPARERKIVLDLRREIDVDVYRTERANHAPRIAHDIVEQGEHDVIIACGGDGTANEVLNGMELGPDTAAERPAFAIVPAGGTNVMSRSLGHPNHPIRAIKHVLRAIVADEGRVVNLASVDERVFMFAAGVGFDAEVVKRIELRRTGRRPSDLAHVVQMLGIYASERFRLDPSMTITVDDSGEQLRGAMVVVGNTTPMTYVGRMPLHFMPDCSLDTHLDFVAPEEANAAFTIGKFMEGLRVKPRGSKSAEKMQLRHDVRSLTIECEEPMPVQADGEYLGDRTHITFASIENAVRFIA
jgi:diacylglycerol kinase family enzyme